MGSINGTTELCKLAYKYGTDKCPQIHHSYTPVYYELFKDIKMSIKKVLEMGIGHPENMFPYSKNYQLGASLYMWRDFFPNAQIYGADIDPKTMFEDDRIKTFLCNETNKNELKKLIENTGSDIDIFIDDAYHQKTVQVFLFQNIMPMLKKEVIYIIEDARRKTEIMEILNAYDCQFYYSRPSKSGLIVIKNRR